MNKNNYHIPINFKILSVLLVIVNIAVLALWQPWSGNPTANSRTIEVSGEATLKEAPDEFTFSPNYQFKSLAKSAAIDAVSKKSAEVVAGLKEVGVSENSIKTDSNGFEDYGVDGAISDKFTYSLQLTVTIKDQKIVQKVQDYLTSTEPTGSVSPYATFSEAKRKQLESKGRNLAIRDARNKANETAQNLGFEVGKVKSVSDNNGQGSVGIPRPIDAGVTTMALDSSAPDASIGVQSGENTLSYRISVSYYIK